MKSTEITRRRTELKAGRLWIPYNFMDLKVGDVFKLFDDLGDESVEKGLPNVAVGDAFMKDGIGIVYSERFKQTINEWAAEEGYTVLDPDGFDRSNPGLMSTRISKEEFDSCVMQSTTVDLPIGPTMTNLSPCELFNNMRNIIVADNTDMKFSHLYETQLLAKQLIKSCGFTDKESGAEGIGFAEDYAVFDDPNEQGNFEFIHADDDGDNQNVIMERKELLDIYTRLIYVTAGSIFKLGGDPYELLNAMTTSKSKDKPPERDELKIYE